MIEITLSCMMDPVPLHLDDFQARHGIHVHVQRIDWASAWDELMRIALYGQGPDVSEIGSTWLGTLVEMDALRPLTSRYANLLSHPLCNADARCALAAL